MANAPKIQKTYRPYSFTRPISKDGTVAEYVGYFLHILNNHKLSWRDAQQFGIGMTIGNLKECGLIGYNTEIRDYFITDAGYKWAEKHGIDKMTDYQLKHKRYW